MLATIVAGITEFVADPVTDASTDADPAPPAAVGRA
jgi:hypothetical protein